MSGPPVPPPPSPAPPRFPGRTRLFMGGAALGMIALAVVLLTLPTGDFDTATGAATGAKIPASKADTNSTAVAPCSPPPVLPSHPLTSAPPPPPPPVAPPPPPPAAAPAPAAVPSTATITAAGLPRGGTWRVDGRLVAIRRVTVAPGRHVLEGSAQGFAPRTDTIRLKAGEVLAWSAKLAPLSSAPPSRGGGSSGRVGDDAQCRQSMASASWTDARVACARAAQGGSVTAARDLALLFQRGNGAPRNEDSAAHWYQQAARGGDAESMYQLASDFERGRGVRKDPGAALDWYTRAANAGHAEAQYTMGQLFERGRLGAVKDRDKAISWYRKAAAQGHHDAAGRLKALER